MTTVVKLNKKAVMDTSSIHRVTNSDSNTTSTKPLSENQGYENEIKIKPLGGFALRELFWGG